MGVKERKKTVDKANMKLLREGKSVLEIEKEKKR